jgi:hypothetical protein
MIETPINSNTTLTRFGNRNDLCHFCQIEATDKKPEAEARKNMTALKGKLEGQKIVKIVRNGQETVICKAHLEKMLAEMK